MVLFYYTILPSWRSRLKNRVFHNICKWNPLEIEISVIRGETCHYLNDNAINDGTECRNCMPSSFQNYFSSEHLILLNSPHEGHCTRREKMPAMSKNALTKESRRSVSRSKTQFLKRKINRDKIVHTSGEGWTGKIN